MRTIVVRDNMRIPLGKQGENNAVRVVWLEIAEKYAKLYGDGRFELAVVQKGKAYPAVVNVDGADLVWNVLAADVATAEVGSLELIYYVGDTIAKSQTWETMVVASKSADGMTEPPEDPARAWFDAIKRQIGDLNKLTTKAKDNLVAAINEAAKTGSGGGTVEMRVDGGYIQYSTDGVTWENLIAVATLEGKPGKDGEPGAPGAPGKTGEPGKDGHTPQIAATKTGKTTSITADGVEIAQIKDGEDAATDISLGLTAAAIGQTIKVKAVDTDGKPTAWEAVDMAGGSSGEVWEKVAEVTLTEQVNSIHATFSACSAVYVQFQWGGVEDNLGNIDIAPNCGETLIDGAGAEHRVSAAFVTTSTNAKHGYTFIKIDTRVGSVWTATSSTLSRGDGTFGAITPDAEMNCEIGVPNNFGISMTSPYYFSIRNEPLSNGVHAITASGAGMAIGTTLKVWGIKK